MADNKKPSPYAASPVSGAIEGHQNVENGAKIKPYGNVKILNSAGEEGQKKRQQMIKDWKRQRSDGGTPVPTSRPHNSKSKDNKSIDLPVSSTREKMSKMKANLLRAYTDDIGEDMVSHSQSDTEEYNNIDEIAKTPTGKTPEMSERRITRYSTFLRVMQETRLTGASAVAFACISAVSIDRAMELPRIMQENGGWYFLVQFFFCLTFIAAPMACIEMALGQLTTQNASGIFSTLAPIFAGMGIFMDIIRLLGSVHSRFNVTYPIMIMSQVLAIVQMEPDRVCDASGAYCYEYNACPNYMERGTNRKVKMEEVLFAGDCLRPEKTDNYAMVAHRMLTTDFPSTALDRIFATDAVVLLSCMYFMGFMIFLSKHGILSFYKGSLGIIGFVAVACAAVSVCFQLTCRDNCSWFYVRSDVNQLFDLTSWPTAMIAACSVMGVGDGTMHSIGMHMGFENNFFKTVFIISSYATMVVFFSFNSIFTVNNAVYSEPAVRDLHPWDYNYIIVAFSRKSDPSNAEMGTLVMTSIGMILLQIAYHVLTYDILYRRIMQVFPSLTDVKFSIYYSILLYACFMVTGYGVINLFKLGDDVLHIMELLLPVTLCTQLSIVIGFYGLRRFFVNIQSMLQKHRIFKHLHSIFPLLKCHLWAMAYPATLLGVFAASVTNSVCETINLQSFTFVGVSYVIFAPVVYEITRHVIIKVNLIHLLQTAGRFGPSDIVHRQRMKFDERAARMYT